MMSASLLTTVQVLGSQYSRYFTLDISETLPGENELARSHNIDAQTLMGMFSAAKDDAPNSAMSFFVN